MIDATFSIRKMQTLHLGVEAKDQNLDRSYQPCLSFTSPNYIIIRFCDQGNNRNVVKISKLTIFRLGWGRHFVPPHLKHSISSKLLGVWSYCFVTFLSMYFPFRKVQFPPINSHVFCHCNHATFWLPFENSILHCFSSIST